MNDNNDSNQINPSNSILSLDPTQDSIAVNTNGNTTSNNTSDSDTSFPRSLLLNGHLDLSNRTLTYLQHCIAVHYGLTTPHHIYSLSLWGCKIRDPEFKLYCDLLLYDRTLSECEFDVNRITENGAKHLAQSLRANSTLRKLGIYHNPLCE